MAMFRPSDGINYNFVAGVYCFAVLICASLLALDKAIHVNQVEGYWIVFAPFIPCLVWSLVVRAAWLKKKNKVE
jgi:hypothetical protein